MTFGRFAGILAIFTLVAFPDVLSGSRSFFTRDFLSFGYPLAYHVQQTYRAGEVPLWNPYNLAGHPFLAQWNTLCLYPASLIYIAFPLPWSLNFFNLVHLYLGGVGMFFLSRHWLKDSRAASVAGMGYAFGGLMLSALMWPNNIAALGWLPLALLCGEQATLEGGPLCLKSSAVLALQFLSGAPEIIALTWCGLASLVLWGQRPSSFSRWVRSRRMALIFALTLGLVSIQLFPFLELLDHSHRHGSSSTEVWSLPWSGLGNFLVPLFRTFQDRDGIFFQFKQQWVTSYYAGATILLLALVGLLADRSRQIRFLGLLFFLSLVLALGSNAWLYDWLRRVVPGLGIMRYPVKFIVPSAVLLPLLAGYGARAWFRGEVNKNIARSSLAVLTAGTLILMALAKWRPVAGENVTRTWQSGVMSLCFAVGLWSLFVWGQRSRLFTSAPLLPLTIDLFVFADLALANRHINPTVDSRAMGGHVARLDSAARLGQGRVMVNPAAQARLDATIFPTPEEAVLIPRQSLVLNANLIERIPKLDGFFSLYLPPPTAVVSHLPADTNAQPARLLDFLGVSYQSQPGRPWEWVKRSQWLPLATLVPDAIFVEGTNAFLRLFSDQFDPRQHVMLSPELKDRISVSGKSHGQILDSRVTSQLVALKTESDQPMLLVLAQSDYPGWRATVDNRPVPLWKANYAFQALQVPGGRHEVDVSFRSRSFEIGALVSAGTLILCGFLRDRWRRIGSADAGDSTRRY